MIDAGWKCSVPSCGVTGPLEIDHIEEWSETRSHDYENLIVLCRNHHGMKQAGSNPRELNRAALRILKANQLELNGRFGDIERRVIDHFVRNVDDARVHLPGDFDILLAQLLQAGFVEADNDANGALAFSTDGLDAEENPRGDVVFMRKVYRLTDSGRDYVQAIREVRGLPE